MTRLGYASLPSAWRIATSAVAALSLSACQLALDVEGVQCTTDRDCVGLFGRDFECNARNVCVEHESSAPEEDASEPMPPQSDAGDELPPQWRCLREAKRMVLPQLGRAISIRIAVTDFVDLNSPPGLHGNACNSTDIPCERPLLENVVPDSDGLLSFDGLPHGWFGYLQISAPGYLDSLVYSNRRYTGEEMPEGTTLLTEASLESISRGGGEMLDPTKGIVLIAVYDCDHQAAPGVRLVQVDASSDERPFYFEGSLPDRDREETIVSDQLTRSGAPLAVAGYSHVDEGYVTMIAELVATGEEVARITVQVRPLTMTIAELNAGY